MREELVTRNVARLVDVPRASTRRVPAWSATEAQTFLAATRTDALFPVYVLLVHLGLRRGEVLGLGWDDVDFDAGEIRIRYQLQRIDGLLVRGPVKTDAGRRTLPLLPVVADALRLQRDTQRWQQKLAGESWVDWKDANLVFTTRSGLPIEPRNLGRSFASACRAAGVRPVTLHTLRHTCASLLKRSGVSGRDAMRVLGHSRIAVTLEVYTDVADDEVRDALTRMGRLLDAGDDG